MDQSSTLVAAISWWSVRSIGRADCVDVTYIPGGPCYLKNGIGRRIRNGNVIGGRLIGGTPVPSTSAPAATTPTTTSAAPAATTTIPVTIGGTVYQCQCTPAGANYNCVCTPTSAFLGKRAENQCPYLYGTAYTSPCGAVYALECGSDRDGTDISGGPIPRSTQNECIKTCDDTPGCVDTSFEPPNSCYLKETIGVQRQNEKVLSARQISGCNRKPQLKLHRKRVAPNFMNIMKLGPAPHPPDFTFTSTTNPGTATAISTTTETTTTTLDILDITSTKYVEATKTLTVVTKAPTDVYILDCPETERENLELLI
ncbi:Nn.00g107500.m01.CDS01 [Neocucurbitaria sp. VM-36]